MTTILHLIGSGLLGFVLKMAAAAVAAASGALALILGAQTRDISGRLNRSGRIAFLGICAAFIAAFLINYYDYQAEQTKEQQASERAQRLLRNVEYGLYPLRGVKASFTVYLPATMPPVASYARFLGNRIKMDRRCRQFGCLPRADYNNKYINEKMPDLIFPPPTQYRIPDSSPAFPTSEHFSDLRNLLESLSIQVELYRLNNDGQLEPQFSYRAEKIGEFSAGWDIAPPQHMFLVYNLGSKSLLIEIQDEPVPDTYLRSVLSVYSIIDLFPGLVQITPQLGLWGLTNGINAPWRGEDVRLQSATITFAFPKTFRLERGVPWTTNCYNGLLERLPDDIDGIDNFGNVPDSLTDQQLRPSCYMVNTATRPNVYPIKGSYPPAPPGPM